MDDLVSRAANETSDTEEELRERWSGSPEKIAEDLFRVRSLETGEMEDLELFYPYQPQLLNAYFYADEKIINVYKGRRIGVSFIFCLSCLIDALINPDTFYPIVSNTQGQANNRIDDIRTLIENAKIDIELEKDNQGEIILPNGSRFEAFSGAPDSSRGDDPAKTVFLDEMAFLEDQEAVTRAFMPFISLGSRGTMVQVSTPNVPGDRFLNTHNRGSPSGENGIVSIKQPTFKNANDIDPTVSLFEQDAKPVRHDLDIRAVETERLQDPKGFAQEYLCNPIADEYRFFDPETIQEAQARSKSEDYVSGFAWEPGNDSLVVLGVDIGVTEDDTVISAWEHRGPLRNLRYWESVDSQTLSKAGINPADRRNPSSVANRIAQIYQKFDGDYVLLDKTGVGEGFRAEIERKVGRGAHGFSFRDKDAVKEMMGDFNYGLHQGYITLLPDERLKNELESIVKKKSHQHQKPKFSGKDHSESGKDDAAMSLVLGAYPPGIDTEGSKEAKSRDEVPEEGVSPSGEAGQGASHYTGAKSRRASSISVERGSRSRKEDKYKRRHSR